MNRLVMGVALCACAILQAVLPSWMGMGQAKTPFLLGGVLYYALTRGNTQPVEAALLAGLLQDSLGPIPLGASVTAFLAVALLVNRFRERIFAEHWLTHVIVGAGASTLVTILLYLFLVGSGLRAGVPFSFVLSQSLGMALLGVAVFPLTFDSLHRLDRHLGNRRAA
jgi:rod shape-determining protein MreD